MASNIMKRNVPGNTVQDPGAIAVLQYNNPSGARKSVPMGQHLLPLPTPGVGNGYTTNVSTAAYALPSAGKSVAVYNSSGSMGAIVLGTASTIVSLSAGATDVSGNVGLPCPPNAWTTFAAGYANWIISSASTLLVFLVNDESSIQAVAPTILPNIGIPGTQQ
jgi:hypothetical protein